MTWQQTYEQWLAFQKMDESLEQQLRQLSEEESQEAFGQRLSFGTAGMRGVLGPGINRMNIYTVRQATEGLAQLIKSQGPEAEKKGVVIAYDSRHMSPEFAMEAAKVLANHHIKAYVYESLRPTPVLSFAVRHLAASAGIMITASHNPSEYNGYKVYGSDGGQMPPEDSDRLTEFVNGVDNPLTVGVANQADALATQLIEFIGDEVDQAYLKEIQTVTVNPKLIESMQDKIKIVYTPLHGTGLYLGEKALKQAGFEQIYLVEEQVKPDGDFPTVSSPNPESIEAFAYAEKLATLVEADIILATDPDADRLGAMVLNAEGNYQLLTGNQIASLMLDYLLKALDEANQLPKNGVVIKSMVSTDLVNHLMAAYSLETIEVLTGFKFIAEKIKEYEQTQEKTFLLGFEESYGYLIKPFTRDKDAIQALVLLAELTAYYKDKGKTLGQALNDLYQSYDYFTEITHAVVFPGISGAIQMKELMVSVREHPKDHLGDNPIVQWIDYNQQVMKTLDGNLVPLKLPKANALKYHLADGSWFAIRPSGTEPKLKLYVGAKGKTERDSKNKASMMIDHLQSWFNA